jgi:hypothetical protein
MPVIRKYVNEFFRFRGKKRKFSFEKITDVIVRDVLYQLFNHKKGCFLCLVDKGHQKYEFLDARRKEMSLFGVESF